MITRAAAPRSPVSTSAVRAADRCVAASHLVTSMLSPRASDSARPAAAIVIDDRRRDRPAQVRQHLVQSRCSWRTRRSARRPAPAPRACPARSRPACRTRSAGSAPDAGTPSDPRDRRPGRSCFAAASTAPAPAPPWACPLYLQVQDDGLRVLVLAPEQLGHRQRHHLGELYDRQHGRAAVEGEVDLVPPPQAHRRGRLRDRRREVGRRQREQPGEQPVLVGVQHALPDLLGERPLRQADLHRAVAAEDRVDARVGLLQVVERGGDAPLLVDLVAVAVQLRERAVRIGAVRIAREQLLVRGDRLLARVGPGQLVEVGERLLPARVARLQRRRRLERRQRQLAIVQPLDRDVAQARPQAEAKRVRAPRSAAA